MRTGTSNASDPTGNTARPEWNALSSAVAKEGTEMTTYATTDSQFEAMFIAAQFPGGTPLPDAVELPGGTPLPEEAPVPEEMPDLAELPGGTPLPA